MTIELQNKVYFAYCRDFEYMAVVAGMLADNLDGRLCREIYGEEFIRILIKKTKEGIYTDKGFVLFCDIQYIDIIGEVEE